MELTENVKLEEISALSETSETEEGLNTDSPTLEGYTLTYEQSIEEIRKVATEELKYYLPIMTYANLLKLISKFQSMEIAKNINPRTIFSLITSISRQKDVVFRTEINTVLTKKRHEAVKKRAGKRFGVLHKILSVENIRPQVNYSLFLENAEYLEVLRQRDTLSANQLWSMKEKALKLKILTEEKLVLIEAVLRNCSLWLKPPVGKFLLTNEEVIRIMNNKELSPIAKFEEIVKRIEQFIKSRNPLEELILNGTISDVYNSQDEEKIKTIEDVFKHRKILPYLEELKYRIALTTCYPSLLKTIQRIKSAG